MPVKPVLLYTQDEARLRKKSARVKKVDRQIRALVQDLKDTLLTQPGAGLAAPQIGVLQRVIVVRFGQDKGAMEAPCALINPVILEEGAPEKSFDGCLSLPKIATWDALRPAWLRFQAQDEDGKLFEMRVEGIDAALVHHEVDHLNGVFFLDRLTPDAELYIAIATEDGEKLVRLNQLPFMTNLTKP
jgi:peptide deformylase